ncbi:MAG TPA: hypothetical protein VK961_17310 [Chthoniobacter sp.]|nr:hypothetical protein [Chthoniobacter sp.]
MLAVIATLDQGGYMPQDYILRLIEQAAAMIGAVIAKRRKGEIQEARQDLQTLCLQNVGLPLETVKGLSPDAVAEHLTTAGGHRFVRAVMLAELLIQDAETLETQGDAQRALPSYVHAFCLLFDAYPVLSEEERAIYRVKLEALGGKVAELPPNPYTTERLEALQDL